MQGNAVTGMTATRRVFPDKKNGVCVEVNKKEIVAKKRKNGLFSRFSAAFSKRTSRQENPLYEPLIEELNKLLNREPETGQDAAFRR